MSEWIKCGSRGFIQADVIRWREAVWERPQRRRRSQPEEEPAVKIGERLVTAEVLRDADRAGWVRLLVRACEIVRDRTGGRRVHALKAGEEIKRKSDTIRRGKPERLAWSEEGVREALASAPRGAARPDKARGGFARPGVHRREHLQPKRRDRNRDSVD